MSWRSSSISGLSLNAAIFSKREDREWHNLHCDAFTEVEQNCPSEHMLESG